MQDKVRLRSLSMMALLVSSLLTGVLILGIYGATTDSSDGSFTLNATPSVTAVNFVDASYASTATLTPDDSTIFGVDIDITHSAGMSDLKNITIWIYDDTVYGSNYNTSSPDGLQLIKVSWIEITDTWTIDDQGSFTEWTEQTSKDSGTGNASTTGDFTFRFDISSSARASAVWNVTVHVYDDDSGTSEVGYGTETALVTMNDFYSVSFSIATFSWGNDVVPNSVNNTHGALTLNIRANNQWELRLDGTDFTPSTIDIEVQNIIVWDEDGSAGGTSQFIRNTIATMLGTWDNQAPLSTETPVVRNVYILLDAQTSYGFVVGTTYTTTIQITIQANA